MNVILASASPRRQQLLKMLYDEFEIIPVDISEVSDSEIIPEIAENIAVKKAQAIKKPDSLVIACDTVVVLEDILLGKPENFVDAKKMLTSLSGRSHHVMTGICLSFNGKSYSFTEKTIVEFYPLSEAEIDNYIASGEPMDKAGGYGIQGSGAIFVKRISGDFYNVVGLPVARLKREIERFFKIYKLEG